MHECVLAWGCLVVSACVRLVCYRCDLKNSFMSFDLKIDYFVLNRTLIFALWQVNIEIGAYRLRLKLIMACLCGIKKLGGFSMI